MGTTAMNKRLSNKTALITGGGSWIGKETAKLFAREGAKVFIIGRNEEKLKQSCDEINKLGGQASYGLADISEEKAVDIAIKQALSKYSQIDILVQNAGIYPSDMLENMTLSAWKKVIDINLTGSFIVLKAAVDALKKQSKGRVVFISSISGEEMGYPGFAHYTASKAGMNGLMRTAALELAKFNITVNSIDPGNIFNEDAFSVSNEEIKTMLSNIPLGRFGQPIDVANLALFLASDESSFITGQNFVLDGGETIA